jgi:hypothetical protein
MQRRFQSTDLRKIKTTSVTYIDLINGLSRIINCTRDIYYILSGETPNSLSVLDAIEANIGAAT